MHARLLAVLSDIPIRHLSANMSRLCMEPSFIIINGIKEIMELPAIILT
jgi:hypothetical protein